MDLLKKLKILKFFNFCGNGRYQNVVKPKGNNDLKLCYLKILTNPNG